MAELIAKRVRFQNEEHHFVLTRPGSLPVHEAALYLARHRKRDLAANSIHSVCRVLVSLYRELAQANVDLLRRVRSGQFLAVPELNRLAEAARYGVDDSEHAEKEGQRSRKVIDTKWIHMRRGPAAVDVKAVSEVRRSATDLWGKCHNLVAPRQASTSLDPNLRLPQQ